MSSSMPLSESRKRPASSPAISAEGGTRKRRWRSSWVGRSALSEFASRTHIKLSYLVGVGGGQTYAKEHLITFTERNGILLNKFQWGDIAKYCKILQNIAKYCKAQVWYVIVLCSLPPCPCSTQLAGNTSIAWWSTASERGMRPLWRILFVRGRVFDTTCWHVLRRNMLLLYTHANVFVLTCHPFHTVSDVFPLVIVWEWYACVGFFLISALQQKISCLIPSLCFRKDKYDRSINKYHVEVDEDDDECSEDLEKELHETSKDQLSDHVSWCFLLSEVGGGTYTQQTILLKLHTHTHIYIYACCMHINLYVNISLRYIISKVQGEDVSFWFWYAYSGRTLQRRWASRALMWTEPESPCDLLRKMMGIRTPTMTLLKSTRGCRRPTLCAYAPEFAKGGPYVDLEFCFVHLCWCPLIVLYIIHATMYTHMYIFACVYIYV